ncbi:MAG: glucosaminidase domain-containing protein [Candidatus Micrarchaeota archaeon]|nr:glucosaminidase domain-containing protein [Candidatus Micrarchaeota archaeon]
MRRNFFLLLAASVLYAALFPPTTKAFSRVSASSAAFIETPQNVVVDKRAEALKAYLAEHNSPLTDEADTFVSEADKYNLDWKLVAAISGVESNFGQNIPSSSYNGWGWGIYGTHTHYFTSWDDAISEVSQGLRENYINKWGAQDVYGIGHIYAADPNWATKVEHYMQEIDAFYQYQSDITLSISI